MTKRVTITEEDLFNFVFSPSDLPDKMFQYIKSHKSIFSNEISYLESLRNNIPIPEEESLIQSIEYRLSNPNIYYLFPNKPDNPESKVSLAAASVTLDKHLDFLSFTDEESHYLVRINKTEEHTTLYLFTHDNNDIKYQIKLFPSGKTYQLSSSHNVTDIDNEQMIDQIIVEKTK